MGRHIFEMGVLNMFLKNAHFLTKNAHFLTKNAHFITKNAHFITKNAHFILSFIILKYIIYESETNSRINKICS